MGQEYFLIGTYQNWELQMMFNVKETINKVLEKYSNKIVDPLDKIYWSTSKSTRASLDEVIDNNYLLDFNGGEVVFFSSYQRPVPGRYYSRAVRAF